MSSSSTGDHRARKGVYKLEIKDDVGQLRDGIDEMEATIERLRSVIQGLKEQRDALEQGNLVLYQKLTQPDF